MKIFDTHIHIDDNAVPEPKRILDSMDKHGVDMLGMFAEAPAYYEKDESKVREWNQARLTRLMQWCDHSDSRLVPIYYINPIEKDALEQVDKALDAGCVGFKIICETHFPGDERAMPVYEYITKLGKSMLFHSGVNWVVSNCEQYNRPYQFSCLVTIPRVKFALAHIGWPWCEECIAIYGKYTCIWDLPEYEHQTMYIDLTPGTPDNFRQRVFNDLHDVGYYGMESRMLFGSDHSTNIFDAAFIANKAKIDFDHMINAGFSKETAEHTLYDNAIEFWGLKG